MRWKHYPVVVVIAMLAGLVWATPVLGISPYALKHAAREVKLAVFATPFCLLFLCGLAFRWWNKWASVAFVVIVMGLHSSEKRASCGPIRTHRRMRHTMA